MPYCRVCQRRLSTRLSRFCSDKCRNEFSKKKFFTPNIAHAMIGATSELLVAAEMLRKGIPVFRPLSFTAPIDLIALIEGKLVTIEVTTGKRVNGKLYHSSKESSPCDFIAVVDQNGNIECLPRMEPLRKKL